MLRGSSPTSPRRRRWQREDDLVDPLTRDVDRIKGARHRLPIGLLFSAPQLHVAVLELLSGQVSDVREHGGDLSLFVIEGRLYVTCESRAGDVRFKVEAEDAFYAPRGTRHRYGNSADRPVRALFAVAPSYSSSG